MQKVKSYIKLIRVDQWIKNMFIFAPILFSLSFNNYDAIYNAILAFIGFSFIASSIYVINDWCDIEADKLHPKKKFRPLASGAVNRKEALILLIFLVFAGASVFLFILDNYKAAIVVLCYFILNLAYSLKLKQYAIIDITIVALCYVIRVFVGGLVTGIMLTHWLIIMTFLGALLIVLGKRKHDVAIYEETGRQMRKSITGYNSDFLTAIIMIVTAVTIVAYIMYTISPQVVERNGEYLYLTSLFVGVGLLRYLQVLFLDKGGDNPTKLFLKDKFLYISFLLWLVSFILISYLKVF
ncbi:decaprenyl-phosphate phosphoribosyltransferase [Dysgonomonas sp. 520]|uniref:decaprenyl-phosphate phosphoribosyltransferase n=1 Tax=Dysgonomonas sp. 520 TaxID=2302931 RepID=UPI0013CFF4FB|nr:decaprenyl-phosphate phosphoribosyltransferase [Dysgonomonas sp. 520]NDW08370.1 decaprenyl-phosphate phosphoribosyltransferase [Dysgonomonas sp. 520]